MTDYPDSHSIEARLNALCREGSAMARRTGRCVRSILRGDTTRWTYFKCFPTSILRGVISKPHRPPCRLLLRAYNPSGDCGVINSQLRQPTLDHALGVVDRCEVVRLWR